ncbi:Fic family protein [Pigmentibacter sp. JX0631]|uniref:Fic family protein n=1 Tax=Pigmentibacter sp. JX0631 TaxID=2976982 RepID=UPI0024693C12|nr:Fic family protein [Pigmentibacter sp. JX0631]WGL60037.1 Fic family protein [Pigmentibacter sp. JX0631]
MKIKEGYFSFPTNSNEFVNLILNINQEIFKNVKMKKLGRFRILHEDVAVDGDGIANKHSFLGVKSEEITSNLKSVWDKLFVNSDFNNKSHLEILCSKFLVHFFAIHPFNDGNGRTARYFLDILFSKGKYQIEFPSTGKRRRQYIKGLRTAHRIRKDDKAKIDANSCYILIDLMGKIISIKKPSDDLLFDEE